MNLIKFYFTLVLICASALAEPSIFRDATNISEKIVGGSPAERHQFPYQISYQSDKEHICGGSILTQEWIVTAGHCVAGIGSSRVVAGMLNQGENHADVQIRLISEQIVHPDYPGDVAPNDIALVRLSTPLSWSDAVQPISLPQEGSEHTGLTWVSGWGYVSPSASVIPTTLQHIRMNILSFEQCANNLMDLLGSSYPLDSSMICVEGITTGSETVCRYDSGGPLMQDGQLLGVTSWTLTPCGINGAPSVYTKVSKFIPWIKQYVPV